MPPRPAPNPQTVVSLIKYELFPIAVELVAFDTNVGPAAPTSTVYDWPGVTDILFLYPRPPPPPPPDDH